MSTCVFIWTTGIYAMIIRRVFQTISIFSEKGEKYCHRERERDSDPGCHPTLLVQAHVHCTIRQRRLVSQVDMLSISKSTPGVLLLLMMCTAYPLSYGQLTVVELMYLHTKYEQNMLRNFVVVAWSLSKKQTHDCIQMRIVCSCWCAVSLLLMMCNPLQFWNSLRVFNSAIWYIFESRS